MTRLSDRRKARRAHDAGHRTTAWLAAVALLLTHTSASAAEAVSLDEAFATPSLTGVVPSSPAWSPDSQRFAFTWNDAGLPRRQLWIASRDGSGLERVESDATAELSVRNIAWLSDGRTILSIRGSGLWSTDVDEGVDTLIADIGAGASRLSVAPNGGTAAWLKGGDVWLLDLDDPVPVQATDVGIAGLSSLPAGRYSRPEREIGPGIWGGPTYAWSPDGTTIAVHYVDRRAMREVPFPDYLAKETSPNYIRRGYPGDPNEFRTVGLVDVASRELTLLELDDPTANQVVGFSWSSTGVLLLDLAADTNVDRWLYTYRPGEEQPARIWHSHRESRIYTAFASAWHPDGETVVFLSDIEDRYGLYAIDSTGGGTPERLTDPGFDVLSAPFVNAASNSVFFSGNGESPYEQDVYRVGLDGGENLRVTNEGGRSTGFPSPDGEVVAFITSSDARPPELYVVSSDGALSQKVTTSPRPDYLEYDWVLARYVTIPSEIDDYVLHLRILEPKNLDRSRRYPVVFGPAYSNTVRNRWRGVYTLVQQLLVQRGYIVVQVDMRGSTGYGRDFREEFLLDFTGEDLDDVVSAANYLKTLPHVDPDRLGIWGSSYGGTLSVYTLLKKPGLFHAGVAAASAVDPYFFGTDDVAIVRRPQTDPEIFERTARQYAANLEDKLLLIHGMQDQVVPFKTIADLAEALIREGKNFDTAFVPGATHAWSREPGYDRYLFGKLFEFFDRHLEPDRIVPAESSGAAQ
ncbi:MAG: prolyl oligopeptidase family serine peptidase [Pseudomonadota bacterium]